MAWPGPDSLQLETTMARSASRTALDRLPGTSPAQQAGACRNAPQRRSQRLPQRARSKPAGPGMDGAGKRRTPGSTARRGRPGWALAGSHRIGAVNARGRMGSPGRQSSGTFSRAWPESGSSRSIGHQSDDAHPGQLRDRARSRWSHRTIPLPVAAAVGRRRASAAGRDQRQPPASLSRHDRLSSGLVSGHDHRATGQKSIAATPPTNLPGTRGSALGPGASDPARRQ